MTNIRFILLVLTLFLFNCTGEEYYYDSNRNKLFLKLRCKKNLLGQKNGRCIQFYPDGDTLSVSNYKRGKLNGKAVTYNENGTVEAKYSFVNGKFNGYQERYYSNGQLCCKVFLKNDLLWNVIEVYDSSGAKLDYGTICDGNGLMKSYYIDGNLKNKGFYLKGRRKGWWYFYTNTGTIIDSTFYGGNEEPDDYGW